MIKTLNKLSNGVDRIKTALFYRPMFKFIGSGTIVKRPLLLVNPQFVSIGRGVLIRDGVRLEVLDTRADVTPELTIGDGTNIEQNVHIICRTRVHIGRNVSITGNCAIVDVSHPYEDIRDPTKIGARIQKGDSYVVIGDGCFLGMGCVILPNVTLGKHVVVGANSVVTTDLPDYCVAAGAPAKVIRKYDQTIGKWLKVAKNKYE